MTWKSTAGPVPEGSGVPNVDAVFTVVLSYLDPNNNKADFALMSEWLSWTFLLFGTVLLNGGLTDRVLYFPGIATCRDTLRSSISCL